MLERGFAATTSDFGTAQATGLNGDHRHSHSDNNSHRGVPVTPTAPCCGHTHSEAGGYARDTKQCGAHITAAALAHPTTTTAVARSPTHMLHSMIRCAHTGGCHSPMQWSVMVSQPGAVAQDAAATITTAMEGLV